MVEHEQLPSQLISRFRTDGVVVARQCVSDRWLEALAGAVEADIESPGPFFHGYQSDNNRAAFMETCACGCTMQHFVSSALLRRYQD